jgi:hypothetical protein
MGIGICCCKGTGCKPDKYFGRGPLDKIKYLKNKDLLFKNNLHEITYKPLSFPNFVYEVSKDNDGVWVCGGDAGAFKYKVNSDNGEISSSSVVLNNPPEEDKFVESSEGSFWIGDKGGSRYGFDDFRGVYGADSFDKFMFFACGQDGIKCYDKETRKIQQIISFDTLREWGLDIDSEIQKTIFYKIKIVGDLMIIGTTGYDPPVIDFFTLEDQQFLCPEWDYWESPNSGSPFTNYNPDYLGREPSLRSIGVVVVNILEVLYSLRLLNEPEQNKERKREEQDARVFDLFKEKLVFYEESGSESTTERFYLNHINPYSSNKFYVSYGRRNEYSFGYDPSTEGIYLKDQQSAGQIKVFKQNSEYAQFKGDAGKSKEEAKLNTFSACSTITNAPILKTIKTGAYINALTADYDTDTSIEYYTDSDSGCLSGAGSWGYSELLDWKLCDQTSAINCEKYDPVSGTFKLTGKGAFIAQVDSVDNPTERGFGIVCPKAQQAGYSSSETTNELMSIFITDIIWSGSESIISLWQGGYYSSQTYKEDGKENPCRFRSYVRYSGDCSKFKPQDYDENNNEQALRPLNEEFNMSFVEMFSFNDYVYLVDSIQYVANGAGPGVYDPISQSVYVKNFVPLIKNFQSWSGILRLTKEEKEEEEEN